MGAGNFYRMHEIKEKYQFSDEPTGIHRLIFERVPSGSRVLDIGCAAGYLGDKLIKEKNCQVWGIESDHQSADLAKQAGYEEVIEAKIETVFQDNLLGQNIFDVIIMADVLEHLLDPVEILKQAKKLISTDGLVIVSLPNVSHYSIRFGLLFGRFDRTETGILDKTHLHFYIRETALALCRNAGFEAVEVRPRGDLERWFRRIGLEALGKKILYFWQELFAVQFVIVIKNI